MTKFLFGDIVVVEEDLIGVVVKAWDARETRGTYTYEVYVRNYNSICEYKENEIEHWKNLNWK